MKRIPNSEKELITNELVGLAESLLKHGLTIPESRTYLRERLGVL